MDNLLKKIKLDKLVFKNEIDKKALFIGTIILLTLIPLTIFLIYKYGLRWYNILLIVIIIIFSISYINTILRSLSKKA